MWWRRRRTPLLYPTAGKAFDEMFQHFISDLNLPTHPSIYTKHAILDYVEAKETAMPKLCKDCRYIDDRSSNPSPRAGCAHPSNVNLITGMVQAVPCLTMRTDPNSCGSEGKLFEQRAPSVYNNTDDPPEFKIPPPAA